MLAGFLLPPMDQALFLILSELASGERAFGERSLHSSILPWPLYNCKLFFFYRKLFWVFPETCAGGFLQCPLDSGSSLLNCHYDDPLRTEIQGDPSLFHPCTPSRLGFWLNVIKDKRPFSFVKSTPHAWKTLTFPQLLIKAQHIFICYQQERIQFLFWESSSLTLSKY